MNAFSGWDILLFAMIKRSMFALEMLSVLLLNVESKLAFQRSMSDSRLRSELQAAIGGAIYRRPIIPGFPADALSVSIPTDPANSTMRFDDAYPPDWLNSLQERFDQHAVVENPDEGPTLYVMVWFVNGDSFLRESPRICRLDADSSWWKSEIIFPWRDQFTRGAAFDLHFVDPVPPKESWQSHAAHIVVSQAMPPEHVAVVVSTVVTNDPRGAVSHTALVVNQFSSAANIVQRFDSTILQGGSYIVRRGRNVFPDAHTVRLGSGDGVLQISPTGSSGSARQTSQEVETSSSQQDQPAHEHEVDRSLPLQEHDEDSHDLEDAVLMQAFNFAAQVSDLRHDVAECAIGVPGEASCEADAFQFNPNAAEFQPNGNLLPAWAQVIEDIYHEWDANAFSWQGEFRVAHFMVCCSRH